MKHNCVAARPVGLFWNMSSLLLPLLQEAFWNRTPNSGAKERERGVFEGGCLDTDSARCGGEHVS